MEHEIRNLPSMNVQVLVLENAVPDGCENLAYAEDLHSYCHQCLPCVGVFLCLGDHQKEHGFDVWIIRVDM